MALPYKPLQVATHCIYLQDHNAFFRVYVGEMLDRIKYGLNHEWQFVDSTYVNRVEEIFSENDNVRKVLNRQPIGFMLVFPHISHVVDLRVTNGHRTSINTPTLDVRNVIDGEGSHEWGCEVDFRVAAYELGARNRSKTKLDYFRKKLCNFNKPIALSGCTEADNPALTEQEDLSKILIPDVAKLSDFGETGQILEAIML